MSAPFTLQRFDHYLPTLSVFDPTLDVTQLASGSYKITREGVDGVISAAYKPDVEFMGSRSGLVKLDAIALGIQLFNVPVNLRDVDMNSEETTARLIQYLERVNNDYRMMVSDDKLIISGQFHKPSVLSDQVEAVFALTNTTPAKAHSIALLLNYIDKLYRYRRATFTALSTNIQQFRMNI